MIQRPEKSSKNLANRRVTIQTESEETAQLIKGISEDWARTKGKITSRLNAETLLAAYIPAHAEMAARAIYRGQTLLDALSRLYEFYASSAGLHPRDDRGRELLEWSLGYLTRSQAQYRQGCRENGYVADHIERLTDLVPKNAPLRIDVQNTVRYLINDYELFWAGNFPRLLLDGWDHWGGHTFTYRIMAVVLRNSTVEQHYIDTPADRLGFLRLVSELHHDCHRDSGSEQQVKLDYLVTPLTLDEDGDNDG